MMFATSRGSSLGVRGIAVAFLAIGLAGDARGSLLERYTGMMEQLRQELLPHIPDLKDAKKVDAFLASDALDPKLVKFAVLNEATPAGLAEFAQTSKEHERLVEQLLSDTALMKEMLIADGAARKERNEPAHYGRAMEIYTQIQGASDKAGKGVLQRLALAVALVHAIPITQANRGPDVDAPPYVDPVARYRHYEQAYLNGELQPDFDMLSTWNLRYVVDGDEPEWMLTWGREMLKNLRPDHVYTTKDGMRYSRLVSTNVLYGSNRVAQDRSDLHKYQNMLMNGGICGRRAFFGGYILRCFGVPVVKRPSKGHAALVRWTPHGWVVNLGPGWGSGRTDTYYSKDRSFLASSRAREDREAYVQVKRAQWVGDLMGEGRRYGGTEISNSSWAHVSISKQIGIINQLKSKVLEPLGAEFGEKDDETISDQIAAAEIKPEDKQISHLKDGTIIIPAAAFDAPEAGKPSGAATMKSFSGGLQIYLTGFLRGGYTILRGGASSAFERDCSSPRRIRANGLGRYPNWGFRTAFTPADGMNKPEVTLDLGNGVTMDFVYIKPGSFIMGGDREEHGKKFDCAETPKHEVVLTKGYYLGKTEVTAAQYKQVTEPGKAAKNGDHPAGNVSFDDTEYFCKAISKITGHAVRLPTEAEWEYAARAGTTTNWFFGETPEKISEYAWWRGNANKAIKPVATLAPNPWGLYDMYGNAWERVYDRFDRDYYANSPKEDPKGRGGHEHNIIHYTVDVPASGRYALTARVVTMNEDQCLDVSVNDADGKKPLVCPLTLGMWQDCPPVVVDLKAGKNTLRFSRSKGPQYGMAVKSFSLSPVR